MAENDPESAGEASVSRSAGLLTVDLGVDLKAAWARHCVAIDPRLRPGPALRKLVEDTLGAGTAVSSAPAGAIAASVGRLPDEGKKTRREISLTPSEDKAVAAIARQMGFGLQEWIVAAVRAVLAASPSFGQAELEALTASNVLLGQVAADLAALEREDPATAAALDLNALRSEIREHMRVASELMAQGVRRWEIKL